MELKLDRGVEVHTEGILLIVPYGIETSQADADVGRVEGF